MHGLVTPHGKLPWFFTASQVLAGHVRRRNGVNKDDTASVRSVGDGWNYEDRLPSKASNQQMELDRVIVQGMPMNPNREKVLRKM
jgi:AGZA family xanthine/uracil permease-like MFS transporter